MPLDNPVAVHNVESNIVNFKMPDGKLIDTNVDGLMD
jgi:hypothetical protein